MAASQVPYSIIIFHSLFGMFLGKLTNKRVIECDDKIFQMVIATLLRVNILASFPAILTVALISS